MADYIFLMHDGHDTPGRHRAACARAVPQILAGLRARGLESVTVSELLGAPVARPSIDQVDRLQFSGMSSG